MTAKAHALGLSPGFCEMITANLHVTPTELQHMQFSIEPSLMSMPSQTSTTTSAAEATARGARAERSTQR